MNKLNLVLGVAVVMLALGAAWVQLQESPKPQLRRTPDLSQFLVTAKDSSKKDWTVTFLDIIASHKGGLVRDSEAAWRAAAKALDGNRSSEVVAAWLDADTVLSAETGAEQRQRRAAAAVMQLVVKKEMAKSVPAHNFCVKIATILLRHGLFEESLEAQMVMKENGGKVFGRLWAEVLAEVYGHTASYDLDWKPTKALKASCSAQSSVASFCGFLHEDRAWDQEFSTTVLREGTGEAYGTSEQFLASVEEWQRNGIAVEAIPARMQRYIDRDTLLIEAKSPVTMASTNDLAINTKRLIIDWQITPANSRFQPYGASTVIERPVVFLTPHFSNFHHALVSIMTRMSVLMESGILDTMPDLQIMIQRPNEAFFVSLLNLLPKEISDRLIHVSAQQRTYKRFYMVVWPELQGPDERSAPYPMQHYRMPPPTAISLLRDRLLPEAFRTVVRDTVVVYSREKYTARHTTGDQELVGQIQAALDARHGEGSLKAVLFPLPKMDIVAQQELFSRALVVVGPHGAGLTNVIWCQPGSVVIERPTVSTFQASIFSHLSLSVGVEHVHLRRKGVHIAQNQELGTHYKGSYSPAPQLVTDAVMAAVDYVLEH